MLQKLRTGLGFRVAMAAAAFAALCFIAPPAVMAFGHGSNTVHCLTNADSVDHGMHSGATHTDHDDHAKLPGDNSPSCCGLFCLSALAPASGPVVASIIVPPALAPPVEKSFFGRTPDLPIRPPIAPLEV
jgi:hypothetical protein